VTDSTNIEEEAALAEQVAAGGIARDAALNLVARVVAMGCSAVTGFIVANALAKSDYGAYAIVVGINVLLVMGLDLGMTSSIARYVAQGRASTGLIVRVALVRLGVIAGAALIVLGTHVVPQVAGTKVGPLLPVLAALVVAQSLLSFHFGALPSLRRMRVLVLVTILQPVAELAFVLVARAHDGGPQAMLLATTVAALGVSLLAWVMLLVPGRAASRAIVDAPRSEQATLAMVAVYGRRIFLVSLLIAVFGQVDQFIIGWFHPLAEVAPYAVVIKLQALVAAPAITIAGIVAPRIAGAGSRGLGIYRQWITLLVVLNVGAVVVLAVLSAEVFGAIGPQYRSEHLLLVGMAPFLALTALAPLPSITLNQLGLAGPRLRIAGITVALDVLLDLALVPSLGAWGAAIATTVAFAYYFVRHDLLVEHALAGQRAYTPSIRGELAQGAVAVVLVTALAYGIKLALNAALDDPADVLVLLASALPAAALLTAWSSRLVRH
jgi:O-antigen/teichoic acid export membrane protein